MTLYFRLNRLLRQQAKKKRRTNMNNDQFTEARDECIKLGLLKKQGKNLNGEDIYVKTEKGERVFQELLEDAKNGKFHF